MRRASTVSRNEFHKSWLLVTAIVIGGFGPVFSLATLPSWDILAELSLDLLAWPIDGTQRYADASMRFLSALTGGFLFGWGVMILCLRQWVYDVAPEPTRRAIVAGLLAWFVLDSAGSIAAGVPSNAVFNVLVLLLCVGPLWRPTSSH
jgi:hypothetical protein